MLTVHETIQYQQTYMNTTYMQLPTVHMTWYLHTYPSIHQVEYILRLASSSTTTMTESTTAAANPPPTAPAIGTASGSVKEYNTLSNFHLFLYYLKQITNNKVCQYKCRIKHLRAYLCDKVSAPSVIRKRERI